MDYKKYNDYELIYMIRENDEESNRVLLNKYKPIIITIANKYFKNNTNNAYDFDDYYQEALLSFYNALEKYDSKKDALFYTFVTICIERGLKSFSTRISSIKKNIYKDYIAIDDISYMLEDKEKDIEYINRFREIENIYKSIIYSAPLESGAILELKYNGFSYREISILLEIPISSLEFKIRKYKRLLKQKLSKYNCK